MVLVGLCLLVVPGVYLAIRFWFATTVASVESVSIMQSFKRAGTVAKGHIGRLLGLNIAAGMLWGAIVSVAPLAGTALSAWMGESTLLTELTGISSIMISILPLAFIQALVVVAYFGLCSRHENINNSILAELPG